LATTLLVPAVARAGEVLIGTEPLATDDSGKITAEGRKAAVKTLPSEPGEELWIAHVYAKIDKGGPGPLYVEFIGNRSGVGEFKAYSHEKSDYQGEKFVSMQIDLDGNSASFNKGSTYQVKVLQVAPDGKKDIVFARNEISLEYVEPEPDGGMDGAEGDTEGPDMSAQDELDTLVGGEEDRASGDDPEPPPVAPKDKKGCRVEPEGFTGFSGLLALFGLGAVFHRRRSARL